ncbi:MAG: hypothetical protein DBX59_10030 [Bacillota bacterium]|nr:MAG: hypothetical protein DBX59_10030 [Bacillota bacterium]
MTELLAPAGNKRAFITAVNCGANAVYLGLKKFSARGGADNFTLEELAFCVNYAKLFGVKVYAAVNTLIKNAELDDFFAEIEKAGNLGVDAFIVQDMLLGKLLKKKFPDIVLHLSTQAGVCNIYGAKLALEYGFSRVILARETKIEDIKEIAKLIETEVFVQGALCSSFSGHCYMSSLIGGNSGNRGLCKQPCRKKYTYNVDGKRQKTGYALSLSDLSLGETIKKFVGLGVVSFKIEGRMRRNEYVGAAISYYRAILDGGVNKAALLSDLKRTFNRNDYTRGLAAGQEENFISDNVQGHIGEYVGEILRKTDKGEFFVKSAETGEEGDAYKILRAGFEVGSGVFVKNEKNGILIRSSAALLPKDRVNITTDVSIARKIEKCLKKFKLKIFSILAQNATMRFFILLCGEGNFDATKPFGVSKYETLSLDGEKIDKLLQAGNEEESLTSWRSIVINDNMNIVERDEIENALKNENYFLYESDFVLAPAKNAGVEIEDLAQCFSKTGEYPFQAEIYCRHENVFIPKSELNAVRRSIYEKAFSFYNSPKFKSENIEKQTDNTINLSHIINTKINSKILIKSDIIMRDINKAIYFPADYNDQKELNRFLGSCKSKNIKAYLYLPAFASGKDIELLRRAAKNFDGIYGEGYYALALAKEWNKELFVGCGMNVFNAADVNELLAREILPENITLSKELSAKEISAFPAGLNVFCGGNLSAMEFIYCPFKKRCETCSVREISLSDDCERTYKVLKYKLSECRFIVYNPYDLKDTSFKGKHALYDRSFVNENELKTAAPYKGVN